MGPKQKRNPAWSGRVPEHLSGISAKFGSGDRPGGCDVDSPWRRVGSRAGQTAENAAHQIAFLHRHELARRAEHLRNTDAAAAAREAKGLTPHPLTIVLDNVRSAENVGSIFRSADCGRCCELVTRGDRAESRFEETEDRFRRLLQRRTRRRRVA